MEKNDNDQPSSTRNQAAQSSQGTSATHGTVRQASRPGSPGKRTRTQGLGTVQRKAASGAAPPADSASSAPIQMSAAAPDEGWTNVVFRPDLYGDPVQRRAGAGQDTSGQAQPVQAKTETTADTGAQTSGTPQSLETGGTAPPERPTTQEVEQAIDSGAGAAVILQRIAELAAQHPGWPLDCWNNATVMGKIHGALTGDEEFRAFQLMDMPPNNQHRALTRFNWIAANGTQASPQTFRAIFATEPLATQDAALADANVHVWLKVLAQTDPLSFFTHLQTGINAAAATHQQFFDWLIDQSTAEQILRALSGTADAVLATVAGHLNGLASGWNWVDSINGTSLSAQGHHALATLATTANATGQAKITTVTTVQGPPAPVDDFATRMDALKTAGAAAPAVRELMQTGTKDERLALLDDAAMVTFLNGCLTGHPLQDYAVIPAERVDFLKKNAFMTMVLTRLGWAEALSIISDRAYIDQLGAVLDALSAQVATWLTTMPAANSISAPEQMSVRALRLVISNAANRQTIYTHFGDQQYPDAWSTQSAAPTNPAAMQNPLQNLDALLAQAAPDGLEIVSMCGAAGAERATIAADAARMSRLRAKTSDEHFFQVLVALGMDLGAQIAELGRKGHDAARIQTLINEADDAAITAVVGNDAAIRIVKTDLPNQPLNLFRYDAPGALPAAALDHTELRTWVLAATNPTQLLQTVGGTEALATAFAPKFDSHGWAWLARVPSGAALLPVERTALGHLGDKSTNAPAKADIAARLGDTSNVVADAATALSELKTELAKPAASASTCLALVTQLDAAAQKQDIITNHRADALRIFNEAELARFMMSLELAIATQLVWMRDKGSAGPETVQMLLSQATPAQRAALFDDAGAIAFLQSTSNLGPVRTMGGLDPATLGSVASKQLFWQWFVAKERPLELLHAVVLSGQIPTSITTIKAATLLDTFDQVPRGTGLATVYRGYVDSIMRGCNDGETQQKMFVTRFNMQLTGDWTVTTPDDLLRLYDELTTLPIAHLSNNTMMRIMNRHHAGGGTYDESQRQANIGAGTGGDETFYNGAPGQYTEKYFDHTVRHEVGHSVDALMGNRTDLVFNQAGWKEYPQSQLDTWLGSMNAWDASGGPAPTAAEQTRIKDLIHEYLQSGGGTIAGPSQPANSLAGDDHPWKRYPHVRVVREMNRATTGLGYQNRYAGNGKVFSINYYYRRFMECNQLAGADVPRDYCMFAPAEWFADMYAEFYRNFDGADDSTLGGNVPGWVKTWLLANVHRVGGRTPHDLTGASVPEGQRAHH